MATPDFLAKRLRAEGEKMQAFFASLSPAEWQQQVYTDGAVWRVRDVLAHFVASERGFLRLLQDVLDGGAGASPDFSIDSYNQEQVAALQTRQPDDLLQDYAQVRARTIAWVAARTPEELQQRGRHPFLGETTLAEMIKMIYRHNQIHYRDLRKLLRGRP